MTRHCAVTSAPLDIPQAALHNKYTRYLHDHFVLSVTFWTSLVNSVQTAQTPFLVTALYSSADDIQWTNTAPSLSLFQLPATSFCTSAWTVHGKTNGVLQ
jgi:hypothetical protein